VKHAPHPKLMNLPKTFLKAEGRSVTKKKKIHVEEHHPEICRANHEESKGRWFNYRWVKKKNFNRNPHIPVDAALCGLKEREDKEGLNLEGWGEGLPRRKIIGEYRPINKKDSIPFKEVPITQGVWFPKEVERGEREKIRRGPLEVCAQAFIPNRGGERQCVTKKSQ